MVVLSYATENGVAFFARLCAYNHNLPLMIFPISERCRQEKKDNQRQSSGIPVGDKTTHNSRSHVHAVTMIICGRILSHRSTHSICTNTHKCASNLHIWIRYIYISMPSSSLLLLPFFQFKTVKLRAIVFTFFYESPTWQRCRRDDSEQRNFSVNLFNFFCVFIYYYNNEHFCIFQLHFMRLHPNGYWNCLFCCSLPKRETIFFY